MLLLFPVYLLMFLLDVAIFFLLIRILSYVLPVRPLLVLDRIGTEGVDVVTAAVAHHVRRWCSHPLTRRQEEAVALLILSVVRFVLSMMIP